MGDRALNATFTRDFDKFTRGNWNRAFTHGQLPRDFESCNWDLDHRGPEPRFWRYVKHRACHWLVNFNLRLAQLVAPDRSWRIVTSGEHSTVWDGTDTLFDFNFLAPGVPSDQCFEMANERHLPPGREYRAGKPLPWRAA